MNVTNVKGSMRLSPTCLRMTRRDNGQNVDYRGTPEDVDNFEYNLHDFMEKVGARNDHALILNSVEDDEDGLALPPSTLNASGESRLTHGPIIRGLPDEPLPRINPTPSYLGANEGEDDDDKPLPMPSTFNEADRQALFASRAAGMGQHVQNHPNTVSKATQRQSDQNDEEEVLPLPRASY